MIHYTIISVFWSLYLRITVYYKTFTVEISVFKLMRVDCRFGNSDKILYKTIKN